LVEGGKAAGKEAAKAAEGIIAKVAKETLREADDVAKAAEKDAAKAARKNAEKLPDPPFWHDPQSVRGLPPSEVKKQIPDGYDGPHPIKKGSGDRYFDRTRNGRSISFEDGWPNATDPVHGGPYMKVATGEARGTIRVALEGNPALKPGERGYRPAP
jgi:hypothetical protein